MNQKQERLFKEYTVWRAIFTMAVPAVINILVMVLYNMADMFFVARLHDDAQVAAISIVAPAFTMMMALGSMLGGGGCALIARTMGEGDSGRVSLYSSLCCWGSVLSGGIFALAVLLGRDTILGFLGANEEMWGYAGTYLTILALGAPVMIFTTAFGIIVRAEGAVKEGMMGNLISTVANVALDPLFILALPFGVAGAAAATVLGNAAGAAYLLWYVRNKSASLSLSPKLAASAPLELRHIIALGLPNGTSSFLTSFASALANNLMVQYGTLAVAAMAAASKSTTIISMVQMGICMGVQPLLAYNYGAKNLPRLRETLGKLAVLTVSVGLAASLLCFCFSGPIVSIFLKRPEALSLGREIIRIRVLTGPVIGLFYIGSNFLQASGNAPRSMLVSLLRQGIFLIPLLYVMNHFFQVKGNVCAHVGADLLAVVVATALTVRQYKRLQKTLLPNETTGGQAKC